MEADKTGLRYPAGLAFSSRANVFYVAEQTLRPSLVATEVITLGPTGDWASSTRIAVQVMDPINMAFDDKFHRLLILQFPGNQLLEVPEKPDGSLDPANLTSRPASRFGLRDPQSLAVDPTSGTLFILDAVGPRIVRVEPGRDGSFNQAVISAVNLTGSGLAAPRSLAFDPITSHLHLLDPAEQKLYELTQTGQVVAYRDLSGLEIGTTQGMVFAPSGDQTDAPSQESLYLADSDPVAGQIQELSLTQPRVRAAVSSFTSALVKTTDTAAFSPPSPDPDGLVHLPDGNRLLMSDSEVEETVNGITHFAGANLWYLTLDGSVISTANISYVAPTVMPFTDEPTGVTWDSANGHLLFSDDNACRVYNLNPGSDGQFFTKDDSVTNFSTKVAGICDTEDITYDGWHDRVFVVDGNNREIYQYTRTGSLVGQFDVSGYGVVDPEGIAFNSDSGTLFVLSNSGNLVIVETALNGELLQTINVSADNAIAPAGLAYSPASDGSGTMHFYIVDRGIDNNTDPTIVDGKMVEMSAPVRTLTATTLSSDQPDPSVAGQPVTINYSVAVAPPGSGTPSGIVIVSDGTNSCTGSVSAGSCSIIFATTGTKTLTATYAGDANFSSSSSRTTLTHTVNKANTTTTITSDLPDPSVVGQSVKIYYSVAIDAPGSGSPTGNVTVSDGSQSCTASVGAGNCSIALTTPGARMLTAMYAGDTNFYGSTSAPATDHTVNQANTTIAITSDLPDPSMAGQSVAINYHVTVTAPGNGTPAGNVIVTDGAQSCTASVAAGSCSLAFAAIGTKSLTATYAGNTSFIASTSAVESHSVRAATATSITSDLPDPSVVGQPVTIHYSVAVTAPASGTPTGNVTISGGSQSCTGSIAAGSCSMVFTTSGTKTLTATYSGDANFISSTSANESHTVNAAATTTVITNDLPDPSVVGQSAPIHYNVTVTAPGSGTPTGSVTISDGSQSCSGSVAEGSCSIAFVTGGPRTLTATYVGDANFITSRSAKEDHTVTAAGTTTVITSDLPDPSEFGQPVTIHYSVDVTSPGSGTPSGTVTVSDGGQSCSGSAGAGSCTITFASIGTKKLSATYAGDANFITSTSANENHSVVTADTTTTITSDLPDPSVIGQSYLVTFSVTPSTSGTLTGNVTVSDGIDTCVGSLASGMCTLTSSTAGARSLTATYSGDDNYSGSTSVSVPHTVNAAGTTTVITSDLPDPSMVGQPVIINYRVNVTTPGSGTPSGTVTVSDGGQSCAGSVAEGSCTITFASIGTKKLSATYAGDANFIKSTSAKESHAVIAATTTTNITSDLPDPSIVGQSYLVTFSVIPASSGTPTGNVTVSDGIDTCVGSLASGMCTLTSSTAGARSLTATYSGDDNYSGSTSVAVPHKVTSPIYLPLVVR